MKLVLEQRAFAHSLGKVVCVGRNYAAHAKELGNPVPEQPLLFIKPATAVVPLEEPLHLPQGQGACHHELEVTILIGERLSAASTEQAGAAIAGVGLGLDLTLRDLQQSLKEKGQPWERAKGFDGACPLSEFVAPDGLDLSHLTFSLQRNGQLQQRGDTADMLFPILDLLVEISEVFTLMPGDVVMTGTPAGVGPLQSGDALSMALDGVMALETRVL